MTAQVAPTEPSSSASSTVSVVIPTYNNLSLLLDCIESLQRQDYPRESVEIVVVDNASTDRTRQVLAQRYPQIRLISMDTNAGFAVACNRGASESTGRYVAFLNNDAVADRGWLSALVATLRSSGEDAVCAASRIMSRSGDEVEYDGASSNLFGAGRPLSVWGWPDSLEPPAKGSPILFASGGAMLMKRSVFADVGGFDPSFFAYFEDVDLGWRLWILGYRVVYAPDAVVRHLGGATGKRTGEHRRYLLWECNSLATIIKNYEQGNMQKILSAALLLEYKRAIMSTGDTINLEDYHLGGRPDTNSANVESLPKVSVAHIAAIDRLNSLLPQLMKSRVDIQARRVRSDAEILPLLGRPYEPQYAGRSYAEASRALVRALQLDSITASVSPSRILILGREQELNSVCDLAKRLSGDSQVAVALVGAKPEVSRLEQEGFALHRLAEGSPRLAKLAGNADLIIAMPGAAHQEILRELNAPLVLVGAGAPGLDHATLVTGVHDPTLDEIYRSLR